MRAKVDSAALSVVLVRIVVPVWILVGALFKLVEGSPASLPEALVRTLGKTGLNLAFLLHFAVGVELAAVGLIWLVPRLARPVALLMLAVFAAVLLGDLIVGAGSCGCFGSVKVNPVVTLFVDGGLLLGIILLGSRAPTLRLTRELPTKQVVLGVIWIAAAFGLAFGYPFHPAAPVPGASTAASNAVEPPAYYVPDYDSWIGKEWSRIDLARWVRGSAPIGTGREYVILYRKDCDHCHHLFQRYFRGRLKFPTLVVAIPNKDGFPTSGTLPMPCTECRQAELPSGCDWFFKTPVLIRLEDGVVRCAEEADPEKPGCLEP